MAPRKHLPPYSEGVAAALLAAREAVMIPIRPILRKYNLTEQQWRLLRVLIDKGKLETTHASEAALLLPPSVSRILKELGERELISREIHPSDARRSIVTVTDAGRELILSTSAETMKVVNSFYASFGEDRLKRLISELREFEKAVESSVPVPVD